MIAAATTNLSFPKITSGRIGGAVQPGSEWRKLRRSVGPLDAWLRAAGGAMLLLACAASAQAQDVAPAAPPQAVKVVPEASDAKIEGRLERILKSTGWFEATRVSVHDGVVFLDGTTATVPCVFSASVPAQARCSRVAVVNRIEVNADVGSALA